MNIVSTNASDELASKLAGIIDDHAGDDPMVSFLEGSEGPAVVWLYAHLVVEVFVAPGKALSLRSLEVGGAAIEVSSLHQGMDLLRRTEAIRQHHDCPYIRLIKHPAQ